MSNMSNKENDQMPNNPILESGNDNNPNNPNNPILTQPVIQPVVSQGERIRKYQFNNISPEKLSAITAKGGATPSVKRDNAKRIALFRKWAKAGKLKSENIDWMIARLENREIYVADVLGYLDEIRPFCHPMQRIALANVMNQTAKIAHGEKIRTENVNLNVNTSIEEWERRLSDP